MATHFISPAWEILLSEESDGATVLGIAKELDMTQPPGGSVVKNSPASAGDAGDASSIPGAGRSPGIENGNLLQYSCLENCMNRGT